MTLELPNAEQLQRIYSKLNMSPDTIKRDVMHLKNWINQQPHLPDIDDEVRLKHMLFYCKNSVEKVKQRVDMYYTIRGEVPEFYKNRNPLSPEMQTIKDIVFVYPLPCLTPGGYRIMLFNIQEPNLTKFNPCSCAKLSFMVGDIRLLEDICLGDIFVFDLRRFSLAHLATYTIPIIRKLMFCMQNAFPIRLKQVHFIYAPSFSDKIMMLIRPFLKKKLAERFYIHSKGIGNLFEYLPQTVFPKDYGGDQPSVKELRDSWNKKLVQYHDFFIKEENIHTDESKRLGNTTHRDGLFGAEGSFRSINVD